MEEIFGEERLSLINFCEGREDEVILFAAVEGKMGRVWVDNRERVRCALVITGDFCYLLGDYCPDTQKDIVQIISELCHGKIIHGEEAWEPIITSLEKKFPDSFRSYSRYAMQGRMEWFDPGQLQEYIEGLEPEFQLARIDESIYRLTAEQAWTQDFCRNFNSSQDFAEHGKGYVILHKGEILSGASSYCYCDCKIEINIETKEEYRRRGLALACAAKLILECLEQQIFPRWDAANMASVALAEKLGYRFDREYGVYSI